jgi:hypothetical protein
MDLNIVMSDMKSVVIAGPSIIPQNPKVVKPAKMAKNINISFVVAFMLDSLLFINLMIRGLMKVSATKDMTKTEYKAMMIPSV